jgi:hypothetical protein
MTLRNIFQGQRLTGQRRQSRRLTAERLESRWLLAGVNDHIDFAEGEADVVSDFALVDLNPNSATYEDAVSPRDYLQQVSGWYFTYAT